MKDNIIKDIERVLSLEEDNKRLSVIVKVQEHLLKRLMREKHNLQDRVDELEASEGCIL